MLVRSGYMRPEDVITIVNATNAKAGAGASFDFSRALGTPGLLAPGAVSGAVDFRLRVATPAASGLRWRMVVSARVRREAPPAAPPEPGSRMGKPNATARAG